MSHFSTIKTELRDRQSLLEALEDLGHGPRQGSLMVRGYRGQTVEAQLAVDQANGADIGFRLNPETGSSKTTRAYTLREAGSAALIGAGCND